MSALAAPLRLPMLHGLPVHARDSRRSGKATIDLRPPAVREATPRHCSAVRADRAQPTHLLSISRQKMRPQRRTQKDQSTCTDPALNGNRNFFEPGDGLTVLVADGNNTAEIANLGYNGPVVINVGRLFERVCGIP